MVAGRLLLSGHRTGTTLRRLRRRHRDQVDLLARVDREILHRGISVLDHEVPVAYCVPGMSGSRIVVSRSTLTALEPAELAAVVAHERSHLRARHDLVLEAFTVLHRAFPRWVSSAAAHHEVQVLVEVLADKAAVRRADRRALASALLTLAGSRAPGGALGALGATGATATLAARVAVLRDTRPHRVQAMAVTLARGGAAGTPQRPGGAALAARPALSPAPHDRARRDGAPVDLSTGAPLVLLCVSCRSGQRTTRNVSLSRLPSTVEEPL